MCLYPLVGIRWNQRIRPEKKREVEIVGSVNDVLIHHNLPTFDEYVKLESAVYGVDEVLQVPCGQCIECRLQKSRDWADRCVIEAMQYPKGTCYFLTLTYDDEHLPPGGCEFASLEKTAISDFMKDLRAYWKYHFNFPSYDTTTVFDDNGKSVGIRFYGAGEYGDKSGRPHYHIIVFNLPFLDDLVYHASNFQGDLYYKSDTLKNIWKKGHVIVADVNWSTCAYVARYVMKKQTGKNADFYIENGICPEFTVMSRRPGIARNGYDESKVINHEFILPAKGESRVVKSIGYYDRLFKELHPDEYEEKVRKPRMESIKNDVAQKKLRSSYNEVTERRCKERKLKKNLTKLVRTLD